MRKLTPLIVLSILISISHPYEAMCRSSAGSDQLFKTISKITQLKDISKDAIENTLGVTFYEEKINPYYKRYLSKKPLGIISKVQLTEPKKDAKARETRLILKISPSSKITYYNDIKPKYGVGEISDIIPEAAPEGLVSFEHSVGKKNVIFQCTAKSYKLVSVIIVDPSH